jgi:hypothetical protein
MTVPHNKIMGFGGDYPFPGFSAMHLEIVRAVFAKSLSRLVMHERWIDVEQPINIAHKWLYEAGADSQTETPADIRVVEVKVSSLGLFRHSTNSFSVGMLESNDK